jgi:hypothetical protein
MKHARKSAATTSTGTTTEVIKTAAVFLDELVLLSHALVSESYLKYTKTKGQILVWGSRLSLPGYMFKDHRNRYYPKFTIIVRGKGKKKTMKKTIT